MRSHDRTLFAGLSLKVWHQTNEGKCCQVKVYTFAPSNFLSAELPPNTEVRCPTLLIHTVCLVSPAFCCLYSRGRKRLYAANKDQAYLSIIWSPYLWVISLKGISRSKENVNCSKVQLGTVRSALLRFRLLNGAIPPFSTKNQNSNPVCLSSYQRLD